MAGTIIGYVTQNLSLNNTSDRWLVVGNYSEIISHHTTQDEAAKALAAIGGPGSDGLADTRWCKVEIVAPGASVSGDVQHPLVSDEPSRSSDFDAFFGE